MPKDNMTQMDRIAQNRKAMTQSSNDGKAIAQLNKSIMSLDKTIAANKQQNKYKDNGIDSSKMSKMFGDIFNKQQIKADKTLSALMRTTLDLLLLIVNLLCQRFGANSSNSRKPPSSDPNRDK